MKHLSLFSYFSLISLLSFGQKSKPFSLEANYGFNGNFFVRSYDEISGPANKTLFLKKKFLGSVAGIEVKIGLNKRSNLGIAYARSINSRTISYSGPFNSIGLEIQDFRIRHTNIFFQLYYERNFHKKIPGFTYQFGLLYLRMNLQEIELENYANLISIAERNFKNSNLEEGGVLFGIQYSKKIDTKFDLGIKSRIYYLISTNSFEAITLTPALTYHFK